MTWDYKRDFKFLANLLPGQFRRGGKGGGYPPSYYQCINHREEKRTPFEKSPTSVCNFSQTSNRVVTRQDLISKDF